MRVICVDDAAVILEHTVKLCEGMPQIDDVRGFTNPLEALDYVKENPVDLALLEEDGITVVDFKTDFVSDENFQLLVDRYRPQVETYANAMERIYSKPIKAAFLYFFHVNRFVEI